MTEKEIAILLRRAARKLFSASRMVDAAVTAPMGTFEASEEAMEDAIQEIVDAIKLATFAVEMRH